MLASERSFFIDTSSLPHYPPAFKYIVSKSWEADKLFRLQRNTEPGFRERYIAGHGKRLQQVTAGQMTVDELLFRPTVPEADAIAKQK